MTGLTSTLTFDDLLGLHSASGQTVALRAVSYTQLDVYKRQSPGREAREKLTRVKAEAKMALPNLHDAMMSPEAGQVKPCLLYTSRCV